LTPVEVSCQKQLTSTGADQMVYELYGITEEEIKIVEGDYGKK